MKTCLFSACSLDGFDKSGSARLARNMKYLEYYWPLRQQLGFEDIVLVDNGSHPESVEFLKKHAVERMEVATIRGGERFEMPFEFFTAPIKMIRFEERLERGMSGFPPEDRRSLYDYPYCWRALSVVGDLFRLFSYDKVIAIDSDSFVLSPKLAHRIRTTPVGWHTIWCPKYQFPDTSLQVIHKEIYHLQWFYHTKRWQDWVGLEMENSINFTDVWKDLVADRFGEDLVPVTDKMDFYGQAPVNLEMIYRGETL